MTYIEELLEFIKLILIFMVLAILSAITLQAYYPIDISSLIQLFYSTITIDSMLVLIWVSNLLKYIHSLEILI